MNQFKKAKKQLKDKELIRLLEAYFVAGIAIDTLGRQIGSDKTREAETVLQATLNELLMIYNQRFPGMIKGFLDSVVKRLHKDTDQNEQSQGTDDREAETNVRSSNGI